MGRIVEIIALKQVLDFTWSLFCCDLYASFIMENEVLAQLLILLSNKVIDLLFSYPFKNNSYIHIFLQCSGMASLILHLELLYFS